MISPESIEDINHVVHQDILALRDSYTAGHTLNVNIHQAYNLSSRSEQADRQVVSALPYAGTFVGRRTDLKKLCALLDPSKKVNSNVVLVVGQPGVGKTALAVQAIKKITEIQKSSNRILFVDLREHDRDPSSRLTLNSAFEMLLGQLGLFSDEIPPDTNGRQVAFHSELSKYAARNEQVILVIDNAADYSNVGPLLPGTGHHRVVVTSRYTMPELNARLMELNVLSLDESVSLLRKVISIGTQHRRKLELQDLERLAFLCDRLPLALCLAAGRLVIEPHLSMTDLIRELSVASDLLDGLSIGDRGVSIAFHTSYERLTAEQARMLRLCILHHGPQFSIAMAAAAQGSSDNEARRILAELCRGHLVIPGTASGYYSLHDLVYRFAANLVHAENDVNGLTEAAQRLLEYWRDTGVAAVSHIEQAVPADMASGPFLNYYESLEWLDLVSPSIVPTVHLADEAGHVGMAMILGFWFANYLILRRRFADLYEVSRISVKAARELGERYHEAECLNYVGIALQGTYRYEEAMEMYEESLNIFKSISNQRGMAQVTGNLGIVYEFLGRVEDSIGAHLDDAKICMKVGDLRGYAAALNNLGLAYLEAKRLSDAIRAHRRACKVAFAANHIEAKVNALNGLGISYSEARRYDKAVKCHRLAKDMCELTTDEFRFAMACANLGRAERMLGNLVVAITEFKNARAAFMAIGDTTRATDADNDIRLTQKMDYYLIYSE
jgi:hypothetical protein